MTPLAAVQRWAGGRQEWTRDQREVVWSSWQLSIVAWMRLGAVRRK